MEIKSNKTGIERSTQENSTLAKALKTNESQASQPTTAAKLQELKEGQQVKGEVLDIRYNEVKLRLEPGKQVVTAKLSGDIALSIGETARFQVTETNGQHLALKYLPEDATATDATVTKALTASGLALTDRNKAIVEELLSHRMPIDKQTIQLLIRASVTNRDASILSLVLMYKNNIPLTAANIRQYESYQNGSGQLLKDVQALARNAAELLKQTDNTDSGYPIKTALSVNHELLDLLSPNSSSTGSASSDLPLKQLSTSDQLDQLNRVLQQRTTNSQLTADGSLPGSIDPFLGTEAAPVPAGKDLLAQPPAEQGLLAQLPEGQELLSQLPTGNSTLGETLKLIAQLYPNAASSESLPETGVDASTQAAGTLPPEVEELLTRFTQSQSNPTLLSSVLGPEDQAVLTDYIKALPNSELLLQDISDGTATLQETLTVIRETLPQAEASVIRDLLQSPEYSRLMETAFHEKWTLTPENLTTKGSVSELYHSLQEASQKLSSMLSAETLSPERLQLQEPVKSLQENLNFLRDLNQMFTFVPLPMQLKDQDVHSELYVFTNKRSLQDKKNLSVLLHLDMTNLGSLNIHVQMDHNIIHTKFYLEDTDAKKLIEDHLSLLSQSLTKKGYQFVPEVFSTYQNPNFTKDLIEQNSEGGSPMRYTFDIRT